MASDTRNRILATLEDNDGLCLDNPEERRQLADQIIDLFDDLELYLIVRVHAGRVEEVRVHLMPSRRHKS